MADDPNDPVDLAAFRRRANLEWTATAQKDGTDAIRPNLANCLKALRHDPDLQGMLGHDEMVGIPMLLHPVPIWAGPPVARIEARQLTDNDTTAIQEYLQLAAMPKLGTDIVYQAIEARAAERPYHPIRDYLASLQWDGISRVYSWLTDYLGAEDTVYMRQVGARFLISAIARVMQPSCRADHCLILEGRQGLLKSTALKTLASAPWFTDEMSEPGSKDAAMQLQGRWIIELAELDSISRASVSAIKAFLTRTTDQFRPPYGRRVISRPRQCVFAGTVNADTYFKDETGNRRFWPVRCDVINIEGIQAARDQLWAEARVLYASGEAWWLDTDELVSAASAQQDERMIEDAWTTIIEPWLIGRSTVAIAEVLGEALKLEAKAWDQNAQNRVARVLGNLSWVRKQRRILGKKKWRYISPLALVTSEEDEVVA